MPDNEGLPDGGVPPESAETESWWTDLFDVRVVVFLVSVVVIAMTATVLLLRDDTGSERGLETGSDSKPSEIVPRQLTQIESDDGSVEPIVESAGADVRVTDTHATVVQGSRGEFVLRNGSAELNSCQRTPTGISKWQSGGSAQWWLQIDDRRTGFFYCDVTYQAKFECQFAVQMGDRAARKFTLYPQKTDFTERFIVRLDKPDLQAVRLIATTVDSISGVSIIKVELIPRK